jgi:integrase
MEEIAALWTACGNARIRQSFSGYIRLLILLGSRRTETAAARTSWIRPATAHHPACLVFPPSATKAGREHILPLSGLALSVISDVSRIADSDLLFPGARSHHTGKTAQISGWSRSWSSLLNVARDYGLVGHLKIHDLRKTARSHWARIGIDPSVCERLLNHVESNLLVGIYDRRDLLDEKIDALTRWSGEIDAALAAYQEQNANALPAAVIPLRQPRRTVRRRTAA